MPLTIGSSGKVSEGTYSKPSDYASSQRSKERERESRYEQQRSNFFSGIFGGGQGSQPGGPDVGPPRGMTRPQMRPASLDRPTIAAPTEDDFKNLTTLLLVKRLRPSFSVMFLITAAKVLVHRTLTGNPDYKTL